MTDTEILEVVAAHKEGKKIQVRYGDHCFNKNNAWKDISGDAMMAWDFLEYDYRVAPEPRKPREWWILPDNGLSTRPYMSAILTEQPLNPNWIHVVEVLE